MPVIHDDEHTASTNYRCEGLPSNGPHTIHKGEKYHRLYGMAERGDKPYPLKLCMDCYGTLKEWGGGQVR